MVRAAVSRAAADETTEKRTSLVDDAYAALKAAIRDSSFAPGYQASEQEIANRLGMSRTPVHEAAIRLQEDGLVKVLPRRGILICALAPEDLREIYDLIIAIEGQAAERLAAMAEPVRMQVAAELSARTTAMAEAGERSDLTRWGIADAAFHQALVERAGNARMLRAIQTVNDQSHRARMLTLKLREKLGGSVHEHGLISDAIRRGDTAAALDHARLHRIHARDELLPLLEKFGLRHL